jgi:hypothetical protein
LISVGETKITNRFTLLIKASRGQFRNTVSLPVGGAADARHLGSCCGGGASIGNNGGGGGDCGIL